jgi:Tfp pilus assembly protein PilE
MKHSRKKLPIHGFSLIELITIIAVIGILVVFNYSSIKSLFDSNREAEVKALLLEASNRQAIYWQQHGSYAGSLLELKITTPETLAKHYKIQLEKAFLPTGYVIKAVPLGQNSKEKTLWLNHLGATSENWNK